MISRDFNKEKVRIDSLKIIAELSYEKRTVKLASGQQSDFYIDLKQTLLNSKGIYLISQLILNELKQWDGKIKGVGGMTMGADPLVTSVSLQTQDWKQPLHAFYIRKDSKSHGTEQFVEGLKNFKKGDPVYILEDVVSTGGSSLLAVEKAEKAGLVVKGVITCVDRLMGGCAKIEEAGYPCVALFTKEDILKGL